MTRQRLTSIRDRFTPTVAEEARLGIVWADYRNRLSPYLLPRPDDDPPTAAECIRLARLHEQEMDRLTPNAPPGQEPPFPHWLGTA